MGFRKKALPLFIDLHTSVNVEEEQMLDLILSPSFYWVKHVSVPVKSLSEVKRFLPSLFEDSVPEGKYSYYAYECGDAYLIFAYDDKKILDALAEKKIHSEQINKIYFAQSEFENASDAIAIDESSVLDVENHVVLKLPKGFVSSSRPLELDDHSFSEHSIRLTQYAHIATTRSLTHFALFMGALIAIFALDWLVSEAKISEFDDAPLELYAEHKLPGTKVQNEVVFETLQKQYEKQIRIRRETAEILDLKLEKNEYITLYDLQGNRLKVEIRLASSKRSSAVIKSLQKRELIKKRYQNGLLKLEFVL